jgi:Gpi18-like mannosyltransferase
MTKKNSTEIIQPEDRIEAKKWVNEFIFVIAMWLSSRLVIVMAMEIIAPLLPTAVMQQKVNMEAREAFPGFVPTSGWELFSHWDGNWYRQVATLGYEYANDGNQHSIAFFPLFPLVTRAVMTLGLPFEVAGTLVNNLALLGALGVLYFWVKQRHGISPARWSTAVLAWCPFSLFGTVIYTEGLFLLLSTAALRAFDNRQHAWAALWGAMATATRVNGAALLPAFLLVAWRERRPLVAYAAGIATCGGLVLFSVYCAIRFGDPLAFVHAQEGWQPHTGFNWRVWWDLFAQDLIGRQGWSTAFIALIKVATFFGGTYLLWRLRAQLSRVAVAYGFCSIGLVIISGAIKSIARFAYSIVPLSIALGLVLDSHPRWGYATMGLFTILLVYFSVRFSWILWVA